MPAATVALDLTLGISSCGPTEVVKGIVGVFAVWDGEGKVEADFMAFNSTSQDETAYGHVDLPDEGAAKNGVKGAKNSRYCPGNERSAVNILKPLSKEPNEALQHFDVVHQNKPV